MNLKWGDVEIQSAEFSLPNAINDVRLSLKSFADQKDITVDFENQDQLSVIRGDEGKFGKVVRHLLSNAIKYTPSGGKVLITVKYLANPPSHLPSLLPQPHVEVSIADNGIGIKPDDQEKIFLEFYQVDSALSQEFEGTGLGLSLASEIVELYQGTIWVESDEGKGSRFTFLLPIEDNSS
jgi:signal transduction histidine kinase